MTIQEVLAIIEKKAEKLLNSTNGIFAKYRDDEVLDGIEGPSGWKPLRLFLFDNNELRKEESNVRCSCGRADFKVNFLGAPYTGGYVRLTCSHCGNSKVLLDDYA